jgi:hypothetical protein
LLTFFRFIEQSSLPQSINNVPLGLLSPHFLGRNNDLEFISKAFNVVGGNSPRRCALHAMPGIGKSQLALVYAKTSIDNHSHSHFLWISGYTIDKLNQGFSRIADLVYPNANTVQEQPVKLQIARQWLEDENVDWLLVFDNVDRSTIDFF